MQQCRDPIDWQKKAERWLLNYYFEGWAEADPAMILDAVAPDYRFYDPLVGLFARASLPRYFTLLQERFVRAGTTSRRDLAFVLRGPLSGPAQERQFWREAPRVGLTGIAHIVVGPRGIVAERVAYDLNLASDLLCRAN